MEAPSLGAKRNTAPKFSVSIHGKCVFYFFQLNAYSVASRRKNRLVTHRSGGLMKCLTFWRGNPLPTIISEIGAFSGGKAQLAHVLKPYMEGKTFTPHLTSAIVIIFLNFNW